MARGKNYMPGLDELSWMTMKEAMAYVRVKTEETFKRDWVPYLNQYRGSNGVLFKKAGIDKVMESRLEIEAIK